MDSKIQAAVEKYKVLQQDCERKFPLRTREPFDQLPASALAVASTITLPIDVTLGGLMWGMTFLVVKERNEKAEKSRENHEACLAGNHNYKLLFKKPAAER